MKTIPVFACANSRLHADGMLIRLRRAGVDCGRISALFPNRAIPNTVACWLHIDEEMKEQLGRDSIVPAGWLRHQLDRHMDAQAIRNAFVNSGLNLDEAKVLEEKIEQGQIVVSVAARNEVEVSIAWHVMKHAEGETIIVGQNGLKRSGQTSAKMAPRHRSHPRHPPLS